MKIETIAAVPGLLADVAKRIILPRYQRLRSTDIVDKGAGELVTIADRETEQALTDALGRLPPAARVIGEEACAAEPDLIGRLGEGWVWLVDPIDGTANFAAGRGPFAIMVALLHDGVTEASWILDPLSGTLTSAARGHGAAVDGRRLLPSGQVPAERQLDGIISGAFVPPGREGVRDYLAARIGTVRTTQRCAGHEYPLIARGECDFALYWRTLPWDHAAGALIVEEAGGAVLRLDGTRYSPLSDAPGLLIARDQSIAAHVLAMLG